jgi:hypothetical protein
MTMMSSADSIHKLLVFTVVNGGADHCSQHLHSNSQVFDLF